MPSYAYAGLVGPSTVNPEKFVYLYYLVLPEDNCPSNVRKLTGISDIDKPMFIDGGLPDDRKHTVKSKMPRAADWTRDSVAPENRQNVANRMNKFEIWRLPTLKGDAGIYPYETLTQLHLRHRSDIRMFASPGFTTMDALKSWFWETSTVCPDKFSAERFKQNHYVGSTCHSPESPATNSVFGNDDILSQFWRLGRLWWKNHWEHGIIEQVNGQLADNLAESMAGDAGDNFAARGQQVNDALSQAAELHVQAGGQISVTDKVAIAVTQAAVTTAGVVVETGGDFFGVIFNVGNFLGGLGSTIVSPVSPGGGTLAPLTHGWNQLTGSVSDLFGCNGEGSTESPDSLISESTNVKYITNARALNWYYAEWVSYDVHITPVKKGSWGNPTCDLLIDINKIRHKHILPHVISSRVGLEWFTALMNSEEDNPRSLEFSQTQNVFGQYTAVETQHTNCACNDGWHMPTQVNFGVSGADSRGRGYFDPDREMFLAPCSGTSYAGSPITWTKGQARARNLELDLTEGKSVEIITVTGTPRITQILAQSDAWNCIRNGVGCS